MANELQGSLENFEAFGRRFLKGLRARIEGQLEFSGPHVASSSSATIATLAAEGALLGRTIWGSEQAEQSGCFLWIGAAEAVFGDGRRTIAELTDEEINMLDQSLRLNVEESGEESPPLEWSPLERLAADGIEGALRETGIAETPQVARLDIDLKGTRTAFLFFKAGETPGDEAPAPAFEPVAREAPVVPDATVPPGESPADGVEAPPEERLRNLHHLLDVRMPLTIRLGSSRMNLEEVLRLTPGSILELDRREEEPLEVLANGRVIARGEVVVVDERFGLRITEIGTSEERLRATS